MIHRFDALRFKRPTVKLSIDGDVFGLQNVSKGVS